MQIHLLSYVDLRMIEDTFGRILTFYFFYCRIERKIENEATSTDELRSLPMLYSKETTSNE